MSENCFYCTKHMKENEWHFVTFQVSDMDREEVLCDECYDDWLQGMKG
ncbi:hypothetical protein [Bacillus sp. VT-16-64]